MTTHDDYMTQRQARDLARRLARLERRQRSTAAAHADLRHSAIDGGKGLVLKDQQGQEKYRLGTDENGVTAPQYKGGPTPERPSEPFVDVGGEVVKIQHSGLDVDENPAPSDFRRAQIHVSQDEVFEPSLSSLAGYLEEADGSFTHRLPGGEWWVGIVWETLSGKISVMSGTVLADIPPLVDAQDIEDTLAEAEQIIADAVAEAQTQLDTLRDRLDNFQEFDPSDLIAEISRVNDDLADARQEAAGLVADLADRVDDIKIPDVSGFITQAEVDAAATAAETAAKEHADLVAQGAKDDAIAEAEAKANAAQAAAEAAAKDYADQQDAILKGEAAADAQSKADAAQAEAERLAAEHAELVSTGAKDDAIAEAERLHGLAIAEAEAAQSKADEAHANAGTAWDHADAAMTRAVNAETNAKQHADNLPKMLGGSTAPTGTAPNGSIWFRRDASNTVIGRWERIGGSWVQQEVSGELIDNLEAGKITALHTEFAESVIGKLWTQLAIVDRLIATSAWIGGAMIGEDAVEAKHITASESLSGKVAEFLKLSVADLVATGAQVDDAVINKLWVDGLVGLSATLARATVASQNLYPDPKFENAGRYGSWTVVDGGLEKNGTGSQNGAYYTAETIAATPGDQFRVKAHITWLNGATGRTSIYVRAYDAAGGLVSGGIRAVIDATASDQGDLEGIYTVPDGAAGMRLGFYTQADMTTGARVRIENVRLQNALDGQLLVDGTVTTRHLHVTQEMVGEFAKFMHLVVDQMNVNALWADTAWQAAGHFGSSSADQSTLVDGTGLRITKHDHEDETSTDIVRLGGEGVGLVFSDEQGNITGSLSHEGDASFRDMSADTITHGGRPLQDPDCQDYIHPSGNQSLITWRPRGLAGPVGQRYLVGIDTPYRLYGFLEIPAQLHVGRAYKIRVTPFITRNTRGNTTRLRIYHSDDGTPPTFDHPQILTNRFVSNADGGNAVLHGEVVFIPQTSGTHRFLAAVETPDGVLSFTSEGSQGPVQMWVEDIGSAVPGEALIRDSYGSHPDGLPDILGPVQTANSITTEWEATWFQNYSHDGTQKATNSTTGVGYAWNGLTQGLRPNAPSFGRYASLFGFNASTTSTEPADQGVTLAAALAGAEPLTAYLEVQNTVAYANTNATNYHFYWHDHHGLNNAPSTWSAQDRFFEGSRSRFQIGQTRRVPVPLDLLETAGKTGELAGFGINTETATADAWAGILSWGHKPKLVIVYER